MAYGGDDETRHAYDAARRDAGLLERRDDPGGRWPAWFQLVLAVAVMLVSVTLAYAALDKRIALIEQKLDYLVEQSSR